MFSFKGLALYAGAFTGLLFLIAVMMGMYAIAFENAGESLDYFSVFSTTTIFACMATALLAAISGVTDIVRKEVA